MRLTSLSFIAASIPFLLCATLACGDSGGVTSGGSATDSGSSSTTGTSTSTSTSTSTGGATTTDSSGSGSDSASTSSTTDATTTDPATSTTTGTSTSSTTEPGTSTTSTTDDSTSSTTGTTTGVIENCAQWQAAFQAEVLEIRGCDADGECGQVLQGTSCGCTRDWVARLDADPAEFWALFKVAMDLGCDLPFSTCDCPATDGFACVGGICTWNYI